MLILHKKALLKPTSKFYCDSIRVFHDNAIAILKFMSIIKNVIMIRQ